MPYPYTHTTRADGEVITAAKYNTDHENHIAHNLPSDIDDYSATLGQMQQQTSPGTPGLESLATNLAGEIERIRYILGQINGSGMWYQLHFQPGWSKGLRGTNDATTPITKYTLQADTVILGSLIRGAYARIAGLAATNDLAVAGPTANGRDQAGTFSASSYVHLYLIWNGSVLATLSSIMGPADGFGPTLPTGYTHYAYACTLRLNASAQLYRTRLSGSWVMYDFDDAGTGRLLNNGQATTFTAVDISSLVPASARRVQLGVGLSLVHTTANAAFNLFVRPSGATHMTVGRAVTTLFTAVNAVAVAATNDILMILPNGPPMQLDYRINAAPATSGGAFVEVLGYQVPNGGE